WEVSQRTVRVAVERAMEQHIARARDETSREACLLEAAGEHDRRISGGMTMARQHEAGLEGVDTEANRSISSALVGGQAAHSTPGATQGNAAAAATLPLRSAQVPRHSWWR